MRNKYKIVATTDAFKPKEDELQAEKFCFICVLEGK